MFPAAFAASINSTLSLKKNEFQQNRHDFSGVLCQVEDDNWRLLEAWS
jgi:hypothetical protein